MLVRCASILGTHSPQSPQPSGPCAWKHLNRSYSKRTVWFLFSAKRLDKQASPKSAILAVPFLSSLSHWPLENPQLENPKVKSQLVGNQTILPTLHLLQLQAAGCSGTWCLDGRPWSPFSTNCKLLALKIMTQVYQFPAALPLPGRHIVQVRKPTGSIQGRAHSCSGTEWLMSTSSDAFSGIATRQEPQENTHWPHCGTTKLRVPTCTNNTKALIDQAPPTCLCMSREAHEDHKVGMAEAWQNLHLELKTCGNQQHRVCPVLASSSKPPSLGTCKTWQIGLKSSHL